MSSTYIYGGSGRSVVNEMTKIRRYFWREIYTKEELRNDLIERLKTTFAYSDIDFDTQNMQINIDNKRRVESSMEVNTKLTIAFTNFLNNLEHAGVINGSLYRMCIGNVSMMFLMRLNHKTNIIVGL